MSRMHTLAVALLLFCLPLAPRQAAADPLRVTDGFLFMDTDPARSFALDFSFRGAGFNFFAEVTDRSRNFLEGFSRDEFRLQFSPSEVQSFTCAGCGYEGDLTFRATGPADPATGGWIPFAMSGSLAEWAPGAAAPLFRHDLLGTGRMVDGSPVSVLYQFQPAAAPIPEPATLLLLGGGLAAAFRRRLRNGLPARQ